MNIIKRIGVSGVGPFVKKQVLDIPKGIVYLYGKNFKRDNGNGNAAGKSLFGSSVAEIFYDTPIVGTRQDKSKKGSRFVEFKRGKQLIKVQSSFTGKSEKLTVTVDGKDQSGRTNKNTRELIEKVWPINEREYRTYGHIDSSKVHHLVGGTSQERKAFFSEFFGLDRLETERKLVSAEISKLKKVGAARTELQRAFNDIKTDMLSKTVREEMEEKAKGLRVRVKEMREAFQKHSELASLLEFEKFAGPKLKKLYAAVPDLRDFDQALKTAGRNLRRAEVAEEAMAEWKAYRRDLERYKKAIEGVDMKTSMEALERISSDYVKAKNKLEDAGSNTEPERLKKPKPPESPRDKALAEKSRLEHQLDHARKFKTGKCHACGQDVKAENPAKIKRKLEAVSEVLKSWESYERKLREFERSDEAHTRWAKEQAWISSAKHTIKSNKANHELYQKRRSLPERPDQVEKPDLGGDLKELRAHHELLQFFEPQIEMVVALSKITSKQRESSFDNDALSKGQERLAKIEAALEVHNSIKKRASKLKDRLDELEDSMKDQVALELLYEGYNDKAVKRMVVEAISTHLMEAVNQYATIAFDDYRFEFVWGTQVQLLVHRPGMDTTDVRKLSGAETKLFTLVLLIALMRFVPKDKRLSMIVLDEPTASFSEETTELFHRLLPHVNRLIPTIIVITPKSNERLEGAIEMTVVRDANGARIQLGHPDEISQ